jgi:hypothetical protein
MQKFKTPLPELTGPNGLKEVYQRDFVAIVCHYFFTHVLPTPARCVPGVEWFVDCIARHRWYVQRRRVLHTQLVERDENGQVTKRYEKRVHVWKPGDVGAGHNETFYGALLVLHRVFGGSVKGLPWADSERGVKMHFVAAFTLAFGYCGDDEVSADHVRLTFFPDGELDSGSCQDDSLRKALNELEWRMFESVRFKLLFLKNATSERFVAWVESEVRGAVRVAGDPDGYKRNPDLSGWVRPPTVREYVARVRLRAGWCNSLPPPPPPSSDRARPQSQALSTLSLDVQRLRPDDARGTGSLSDPRPQGHSHIWLRTGRCRWHPDYMYHPHFCDRCYPAGTLPREVVEWVVGAVRAGLR